MKTFNSLGAFGFKIGSVCLPIFLKIAAVVLMIELMPQFCEASSWPLIKGGVTKEIVGFHVPHARLNGVEGTVAGFFLLLDLPDVVKKSSFEVGQHGDLFYVASRMHSRNETNACSKQSGEKGQENIFHIPIYVLGLWGGMFFGAFILPWLLPLVVNFGYSIFSFLIEHSLLEQTQIIKQMTFVPVFNEMLDSSKLIVKH